MARVGRNKNANISLFSLILQTTILLAEHIQSYATSRMLLYHVTKGVAVKNITKPLKVATKKKKILFETPSGPVHSHYSFRREPFSFMENKLQNNFFSFFFFFSDFSRMKSAKTSFVKLFPLV